MVGLTRASFAHLIELPYDTEDILKALIALSLGLVTTLALVACDAGEERLTEEEFISQANEACTEGNQEIQEAAAEIGATGEQPSQDQLEDFIGTIAEAIQGQIDDIAELSPPEDLEQDVDALTEELQSSLDELREQGAAALQSQDNPFADANEMAGDLGLTVCAEG